MRTIVNLLQHIRFLHWLWISVLCFVVHELEEWNITAFERRNFEEYPTIATARNAHAWIAFICVVGVVWCAAATLPGNPTVAAYVFLPAIVSVLLNALQHVYWSLFFRQYAPGVITAVMLLIPLNSYVIVQAVQRTSVSIWYVALLLGGLSLGLIHTVAIGRRTPHIIQNIYNIGYRVSETFSHRRIL